MSARAGRWDLLDVDRDPVPGEPQEVRRLAEVHTSTADDIRSSSDTLRRLAELDEWRGKAATRFAEAAEDVAHDLGKAHDRYRDAGTALAGFVGPLQEARDESWAALQAAVEADDRARRTAGDTLSGVQEPTPEQVSAQQRRQQEHDEAVAAMGAARERLTAAMTRFGEAASRCAEALREAAESGKDSRWDNVKGGLRDFADWARLDVVVQVLAAIAITLALVALVVGTGGTALFVLGMGVGLLSLAANTTMAVSEHEDGSWTAVALDLAGVLTLGGARWLTAAGRTRALAQTQNMATSARGSASAAETARIAQTVEGRAAAAASHIADPLNNLRRWSETTRATHAAQAAAAGDGAASVIVGAPGKLDEAAKVAAEVRRLQAFPEAANPATARALAEAATRASAAGGLDRAGAVGNVVQAADLTSSPFLDPGLMQRTDNWFARWQWRLSR